MATLNELLGGAENRPKVIQDCVDVIDAEVKDKGGLSGMAIKAGYAVVNGIKPTFTAEAVDHLLEDFARALDPTFQEAKAGGKAVAAYFVERKSQVADALLAITDAKAKRAKTAAVVKTYEKLRGTAKQHVEAAVPRLGKLIEKYDRLCPPAETIAPRMPLAPWRSCPGSTGSRRGPASTGRAARWCSVPPPSRTRCPRSSGTPARAG